VLDLALTASPTAAVAALREAAPTAAIVALSEVDVVDEEALHRAGAARVAGKSAAPAALADLVLHAGLEEAAPDEPAASGSDLTDHERSLLRLLAAGYTNTEIGEELFLAPKTIERQVATVTRKLGARNRSHAAALAVANKIVEPPRG
jgi:DNA-binding NarL/FixJ family response regulator